MTTPANTPSSRPLRDLMVLVGPEALDELAGDPTPEDLALVAAVAARIRVDDLDDAQLAAVLGIRPGMAGTAREALTGVAR